MYLSMKMSPRFLGQGTVPCPKNQRGSIIAFLDSWCSYIGIKDMMKRKLSHLIYVSIMSILLCLLCIPGRSAQTIPQEIKLSEQSTKTLSCLWINGRSLLTNPPIPISAAEPKPGFFYLLSYPNSNTATLHHPYEVDYHYLSRLLPAGSLENTLTPYRSTILSPSGKKGCFPLDQLSNEVFLYYQNKEIDPENPYGLYYLVNPYRNSSQLVFSIPHKETSPVVKYGGYLNNPPRFCFFSEHRLFLLDPSTKEIKMEATFPQTISYVTTDLHSLFLFIDSNLVLNAYSTREHHIIWQNSEVMKKQGSYSTQGQQNISIKAVSTNDQWFLVSLPGNRFFILSSTNGKNLASFSIPIEKIEIINPFREWFGSIWIQYVEKEKENTIQKVRFIRVSQNREKQFDMTRFELDDPYIDPIQQTRLHEANPTYFAYIPLYHQLFILYRDKNDQEIQTVFGLP